MTIEEQLADANARFAYANARLDQYERRIDCFMYLLTRDLLPWGAVKKLLRDHMGDPKFAPVYTSDCTYRLSREITTELLSAQRPELEAQIEAAKGADCFDGIPVARDTGDPS